MKIWEVHDTLGKQCQNCSEGKPMQKFLSTWQVVSYISTGVYRTFGRFVLPRVWSGGISTSMASSNFSSEVLGQRSSGKSPKPLKSILKAVKAPERPEPHENLSALDVICMCVIILVQILTLDFKQIVILEGNSHNFRTERDLICSSGHESWAPEESLGESIKEAHYLLINLSQIMEIEFHLPPKS